MDLAAEGGGAENGVEGGALLMYRRVGCWKSFEHQAEIGKLV